MDVIPVCEVPRLPRRTPQGHKGTYGTVLVIAGSRGMTGAAVLVGRGALHSGAGLVRVACPACVQDVVSAGHPCYTTFGIRQHTDGSFGEGAAEELLEFAQAADVVAIGPGLGQGASVAGFVLALLTELPSVPIVLDADGLNAISPFGSGFPKRSAPLVMTPHPGEFARLLGRSVQDVLTERESLAVDFARRAGVVLLLKGSGTLVTDSQKLYRNTTGNPGMATGGSGDVLTGVIAALIGQGLAAFDAAVLGAWVHGRAGDIAATKLGQVGLTAADLADYLPAAFREIESSW
ncbi:MAG TPA: NAD(P)H-hydrate dehydratase [Gemmata sp.]|nr:NAD(P)H-hydrate dehydratase [Gemmata sp.]